MVERWEYSELAGSSEAGVLGQIFDQCFIGFAGQGEKYIHRVGERNCRILRSQKQIIGGLVIIPLGQWWGNCCVEMGGIAAVGIAPEFRGVGAAKLLIQQAVQEMYRSGIAISTLFPVTQYLYRQVGYENAMVVCKWEIDCDKINVHEQPLSVENVEIGDLENLGNYQIFQDLYAQQAPAINGYIRRDDFLWSEKFRCDKETVYGYLFGDRQHPQGYIIYNYDLSSGDNILQVRDWVLITPDAVKSFWGFLTKMRSQIDRVRWRDAGITALTLALPENMERLHDPSQAMMRIVNVVSALEQRDYSADLTTELHLQIHDDLILENNGNFILKIAAGQGKIELGGKGDFQLDIKALAGLYTSLFAPSQLQLAGKLSASQESIATANVIFAGALPTISDYF
jgi:predicted acetyltransferase